MLARFTAGLAAAVGLLAPATAGAGELAIGARGTELVVLDTDAPGTPLAIVPVPGLVAETLADVDVRPANGELWALTTLNRALVLDPATGARRQMAAWDGALLNAGTTSIGTDFNPTVDRWRGVSTADDNVRFNPVTLAMVDGDAGTAGTQGDADLSYIIGDAHAGANPAVAGLAYDRNDSDGATATTLFGIDATLDTLVRQGAVDGNAGDVAGGASPNGGLLTTIGPLGVDTNGNAELDIGGAASAWAALQPTGETSSSIYRVNLATGAATATGTVPGGPLTGLAIVPGGGIGFAAPNSVAGESGGAATVTVRRRGDTLAAERVPFHTADRDALAGRDYTAVSGVLEFAAGERTRVVTVPLLGDGDVEGPEAFAVELGAPERGAWLESPTHTVEITDDDVAPAPPLAAPGAPPSPGPGASLADRAAPTVLLVVRRPRTLAALRRAGTLRVDVGCSEACTGTATLTLGPTRLGTVKLTLKRAGTATARVKLTAAGKRALQRVRARRASITLTVVVRDAAGNRATKRSTLRLARR